MLYVSESPNIKTLFCVLSILLVTGCGQPSGNAPGGVAVPEPGSPPVTFPDAAVMKYGESVTTAGGWTVSVDSSDPVESAPLANGWTVEVLDE